MIEKIKKLIKEKNVTPYAISKSTGVSEATLSRILSGKTKRPNASTLASVFSFLEDYSSENSAKNKNNTQDFSLEFLTMLEDALLNDSNKLFSSTRVLRDWKEKNDLQVENKLLKELKK